MDVAGLNSKCVSRNKNQNIFQSRTIACYTRERVKREEKETIHHQLSSLYIRSVRYSRIILHASMYQPNNPPMILHTEKLFLSVQPRHNIRRRNTSSYILILSLSLYIILTPPRTPYVLLEPSSPLSSNECNLSCILFLWAVMNVTYHASYSFEPSQPRHVRSLPLHCTRIDSSGFLTTWTANLVMIQLAPRPRPEVAIRQPC